MTEMNTQAERIARNEALFRQVNEQVESLNDAFGTLANRMIVVCECGSDTCIEQIDLTREEYEGVRQDSAQFVVKPGHLLDRFEYVTAKADRYWIIKKEAGEPQQVAADLDPRGR
jgi:hypothetical protein